MIIIGQVSEKTELESQFEISFNMNQEVTKDYFIDREGEAWVIFTKDSRKFMHMNYGLIPFWSKDRILHFESPIEGSENPSAERIKKRIILHPSYRKPIRESRCLVPADYFIVANTQKEPFLLFSTKNKPFALAGIYDNWKASHLDKAEYTGFSILTSPVTENLKRYGIERIPIIIEQNHYKLWLKKDAALAEITSLINPPEEKDFNGYPINRTLYLEKSGKREISKPVGELIFPSENKNIGSIAEFLRSFRYKRGVSHGKETQEKRIWRVEG